MNIYSVVLRLMLNSKNYLRMANIQSHNIVTLFKRILSLRRDSIRKNLKAFAIHNLQIYVTTQPLWCELIIAWGNAPGAGVYFF
ncbi:MAG: hypothetical protein DRR19_25030 [Candidatus Parabeggiatoa sp. nov. 1]|nr:MAG: hypothetical protein DRR19_25030 [Gammaproteobacteria bacterium]